VTRADVGSDADADEFSELPQCVREAIPNVHAKTPQMAVLEYEERYLEIEFTVRECPECAADREHKRERDHYEETVTLECGTCGDRRREEVSDR